MKNSWIDLIESWESRHQNSTFTSNIRFSDLTPLEALIEISKIEHSQRRNEQRDSQGKRSRELEATLKKIESLAGKLASADSLMKNLISQHYYCSTNNDNPIIHLKQLHDSIEEVKDSLNHPGSDQGRWLVSVLCQAGVIWLNEGNKLGVSQTSRFYNHCKMVLSEIGCDKEEPQNLVRQAVEELKQSLITQP